MATTKVSALTAKNTLGGSEEILINDGGVSKKSTVAGITLAGEVTGAVTGVVIAANVVDEANLKVSNTPTNGYVLTAQSGNTGGLTWAQDSATDSTKLPLAGGTMTGNIVSGDNVKATYGTGADLQIYHNGTHSYIDDTGTGDLRLRGSGGIYLGKYTGESMVDALADGAVTLYHNNASKLATTSTGINVTGTVTADGAVNSTYFIGGSSSVAGRQLTLSSEDGTGGNDNATHRLSVPSGYGSFAINTAGSERIRIDSSGNVGIGTTSPSTPISWWASSGNGLAIADDSYAVLALQDNDSATYTSYIVQSGGNMDIWNRSAGVIRFGNNGSERMRIDSSGNVGIGTTSPDALIETAFSSSTAYSTSGQPTESILISNINGSDGSGVNNYATLGFGLAAGATSQGFINYVRTADNAGAFTISQRIASSTYKEHLRITSAGNLGIGTVAPNYRLHVDATANDVSLFQGANSGNLTLRNATANEMIIHTGTSDALIIGTSGNTERMRINAGGQVLIGTTAQLASSAEKLTVYSSSSGHTRLRSSSDSTSTLYIENTSTTANTNQPAIIMTAGGGNRGGIGIRYSDSSMWLSGQGGFHFWTGSSVGGGTEKMTIASSGKVGIGTASPAKSLHVQGNVLIDNPNNGYGGFRIKDDSSGNYNVYLDTGRNQSATRIWMRYGARVQGTTPWTDATPANICSFGQGGIAFGSDTAAANTLDDYEEGYHVPTITGSSSGSWTLGTYNTLAYTKIGRVVHIQGYINVTSESSPSGSLRISLPFAIPSLTDDSNSSCISVSMRSHGGSSLYNVAGVTTSNSVIEIIAVNGSGTANWIDGGDIGYEWNIRIGGSYIGT